MLNTQLSPWPSFSEEEISAVSQVLQSNKVNYWTGQQGRDFEKEFANYTDSQYAIALANGTLALDLALHALDIGCGDEVIVTSRTFIASISSHHILRMFYVHHLAINQLAQVVLEPH